MRGSAEPKYEFLFAYDLINACYFLMQNYKELAIIKVGTPQNISIKDLDIAMKDTVGFKVSLFHDTSKPGGTPLKLLDVCELNNLGRQS